MEVGTRVLQGPFRGLILSPMTHREHIGPYLLGTYEHELHPWWDDILLSAFDQVIDVGAKFGYYAVGLAQRLPSAQVVAFDTDWWARRALREMATANGVSNLVVSSWCDHRWLLDNLRPHALILSDCEGYEADLLCGENTAALSTATLVVELHEALVPGVTARVVESFSRSHQISGVESEPAVVPPETSVTSLNEEELARAASEARPQQEWILLRPSDSRLPPAGS